MVYAETKYLGGSVMTFTAYTELYKKIRSDR